MKDLGINLRLLRIFRLHTTEDLLTELNVAYTLPKNGRLEQRQVDLAEAIEQRQKFSLCSPCDDVSHWF